MSVCKKFISVFLALSLLTGFGLLNCSTIVAYAEEESIDQEISPFDSDMSDPYNPVYYDENGNEVDMAALKAELGVGNPDPGPVSLPESYDARNDHLITNVKHQGNYGTCWAHATMSCLEADAIKKGYYTESNADFSEAHLAWFEKNPVDSITGTSANDGNNNTVVSNIWKTGAFNIGGYSYSAIATLSRMEGVALERDYPYNDVKNHSDNLYSDNQRYDTGSGLIADSMVALEGQKEIKQWIKDHGAAFCGYNSSSSTMNGNAYYTKSNKITHAVTIVGWDDNYSVNNFKAGNRPSNNGAWLVKNSWGTDWCDNGYFWMSYETTPAYYFGFTVSKSEGIKNNYTYNGVRADVYEVKVPSNWLTANVFEAKGNEKLSKVSFYTGQRNLDVDIKIYKLEKGFRAPISGNLVYMASETYRNEGYHTVNLNKKIELAQGQLFSVVIEYNTSAAKMIIKCESPKGDSRFVSKKGESWFGYGGDWIDTSVLGYGNNYINAITESSSGSSTPAEQPGVSASPSNVTIEKGETKSICVAFSPWKTGNYNVHTEWAEEEIISCEYEPAISGLSSSVFYNGVAKLNIKGLKAGTAEIKIKLLDPASSGAVLDTFSVHVTVKNKADYGSIKVSIREPATTNILKGMDTLRLHATAENLPAGAELAWAFDGNILSGECVDCMVNGHPDNCHCLYLEGKNQGTVTVYCVAVDANGNFLMFNGNEIYDSVEITVTSPGFLIRIIDFFLKLFGSKYGIDYDA
ncbi:MAG: hypothetical protein IK080_01635 [Clostridia bacterium]|nr:hypothetical protein [Clostridia bacterium]